MGVRGYGGGGRGRLYTYHYTVTTRMTCINMGSDESHFNVSLTVRDKVTSPQTTTFEEKREPKRYRTEVLPLCFTARPNRLSEVGGWLGIGSLDIVPVSASHADCAKFLVVYCC